MVASKAVLLMESQVAKLASGQTLLKMIMMSSQERIARMKR